MTPTLSGFSDKTEYTVLDPMKEMELPPDVYTAFETYGDIILISYSVICAILLGNLLIAIITNRYK